MSSHIYSFILQNTIDFIEFDTNRPSDGQKLNCSLKATTKFVGTAPVFFNSNYYCLRNVNAFQIDIIYTLTFENYTISKSKSIHEIDAYVFIDHLNRGIRLNIFIVCYFFPFSINKSDFEER